MAGYSESYYYQNDFVPPDYTEFIVEPKSFLEDYLQTGLKEDKLGDPRRQELFELMMKEENPLPGFSVDPNKLDLRQYRRPDTPIYPGEFLDRDQFLRGPRSPLT